jgi:membrane-bound acyltransferase YfiQ involved in biofilm formation
MQKIEEIYWLRAYGCIAVFLFHWLDHLNQRVDNLATDLMRIPLVLGTPVFLFISIFVFAVRYDKQVPPGFLLQRVKYVMLPYLMYGFISLCARNPALLVRGGIARRPSGRPCSRCLPLWWLPSYS